MAIKKIKMHPPGNNTDVLHPETETAMVLTTSGNPLSTDLNVETAGGTATAITLTIPTRVAGYQKTFVAAANNNGAATTINTRPVYKPNTTTAPTFVAGRAYTVWYNGTYFFCKASAEGDAVAADVLAGKYFSNDNDMNVVGTMKNRALMTGGHNTGIQRTAGVLSGDGINYAYLMPADGFYDASGAWARYPEPDLLPANIKKDVNIFGVVGSYTEVTANIGTYTIDTGQTITAGDLVEFINGNKVSKATEKLRQGGRCYFTSHSVADSRFAVKLDSSRVLVLYDYTSSSHYVTAVVITISGTTITYGTPVSYATAYTSISCICGCLLSTDKVFLYFGHNSGSQSCAIITVSGTTPTFNTVYAANAEYIFRCTCVALSATTVLLGWIVSTSTCRMVVATVSGTVISYGSYYNMYTGGVQTNPRVSLSVIDSTRVLWTYCNPSNSNYLSVIVLTISGTTITQGTPAVIKTESAYHHSVAALSTALAVGIFSGYTSNKTYVLTINISGTTVTPQTPVVLTSQATVGTTISALTSTEAMFAFNILTAYTSYIGYLDCSGGTPNCTDMVNQGYSRDEDVILVPIDSISAFAAFQLSNTNEYPLGFIVSIFKQAMGVAKGSGTAGQSISCYDWR